MNITRLLNQVAVRWVAGAADERGNTTYAAGVEIACRWENKRELFLNARGEKELSKAIIYTEVDTTAIELDDKLYLGTLASLTAAEIADPNVVVKSYRVRGDNESRSVDASQGLGKAFL